MEFTWGMLQPFDEHVQAVKTVSRSPAGKANVVNEVSAAKAKAFSIVEFCSLCSVSFAPPEKVGKRKRFDRQVVRGRNL